MKSLQPSGTLLCPGHKLRIYSLPDMTPIEGGGIEVFVGEEGVNERDPMGIALYKAGSGKIYAITGRKSGPTDGTYLWQYLLDDNGKGKVKATLVRKFGAYSGLKEIESIAVDDKVGSVYYSGKMIILPAKHQVSSLFFDKKSRFYVSASAAICGTGAAFSNCTNPNGALYVSKNPQP